MKGKPDKIPFDPKTGGGAKANDVSTWGTFEQAVSFAERQALFANGTGGIGFEFALGIAGIDLDNVILPCIQGGYEVPAPRCRALD